MAQDDEKVTPVLGFGDRTHSKLEQHMRSKTPVRMQLTYNQNYSKYVVNEFTNIDQQNNISFKYQEEPENYFVNKSEPRTVDQCTKLEPKPGQYYTITGKIILGPLVPHLANTTYVKEDVVLIDRTGQIDLHIWYPLYEQVKDGEVYCITHLVPRTYRENTYLSTTKSSVIEKCEMEIDLAPNIRNYLDTVREVNIKNFIDIVKISDHFICSCNKRIEFIDSSKLVVKCPYCKRFKRIKDLIRNTSVQVSFELDNKEEVYTVKSEALSQLLETVSDDEEMIACQLLEINDITVKVDVKQKTINAVVQ